jgi:membrane protein DedA with SNARE-associated domain
MFAHLLDIILTLSGWPAYVVILAIVFAEAALFAGFVLPGETALLFGGVLAAGHHLSLALLIPAAVVAAVAGDSVGFEVGRRYGPRLLATRLGRRIDPAAWIRVQDLTRRRGGWAVFAGRWTALLRALVPTAAGAAGMRYRTFVTFNLLGGITWVFVVTLLGYTAGASVTHITALLGHFSLALLAVLAILCGALIWRHRRRRQLGVTTPAPPSGELEHTR